MTLFYRSIIFLTCLLINVLAAKAQKANSVLFSGRWVKVAIEQTGVYKISYKKLSELGFVSPEKVRVFGNAFGLLPFMNNQNRPDDIVENKVMYYGDALYFFAQGADIWSYNSEKQMFLPKKHLFSRYAYYFLSDVETGYDNAVEKVSVGSLSATEIVDKGIFLADHEQNLINLQMSGRRWYGESFYFVQNRKITVDMPVETLEKARVEICFATRSTVDNTFDVKIADEYRTVLCKSITSTGTYAVNQTETFDYTPENSKSQVFDITFNKLSASAEGYLDYIVVNANGKLKYDNENQLIFRYLGIGNNVNFLISSNNSNIFVWDITNSTTPQNLSYSFDNQNISFVTKSDTATFVVFQPENALEPVSYQNVSNQNLHSLQPPEMLIICPDNLISYAQQVGNIHSGEMSVAVVGCGSVYNEFSCGSPDVSAIRDFIRFLYKKDNGATLKYVLLFGDGSVDNFTQSDGNPNLMLTYQSPYEAEEVGISSFVSDDFFALLGDDEGEYLGNVDVGVGRLPVKNTVEAKVMVDKINAYISAKSEDNYRSVLAFIADDEDFNVHTSQADYLAEFCEDSFSAHNIKKIYLDAYAQQSSAGSDKYPLARKNIVDRFESGAKIINYTGHGGMDFFADEMVLTTSDIENLTNFYRLPIFITATCDVGRYDYYDAASDKTKDSPAEKFLLNESGGAVALITSARTVLSNHNFEFNKNVFKNILLPKNFDGSIMRLGDVVRIAKNQTNDYNMLNFTLLGDPALAVASNNFNAEIVKINGKDINVFQDTLKALQKVEVECRVSDLNGLFSESFNGRARPIVYDKQSHEKTLNNDGNGVFEYKYFNKIIYNGDVSVLNGSFKFTFVIPKDINPEVGLSKILLYANNGTQSALGSNKKIKIGSFFTDAFNDVLGPEIKLYLNDFGFIDGDKTTSSPLLIACISDSSGINTIEGSGHDIVLEIDGDRVNSTILNQYFVYNQDSYTDGKIEFKIENLDVGNHTLSLKVWDSYNNGSEKKINFTVVDGNGLKISRLFNYPNPFTDKTSFYFEHNNPQSALEYEITVFSVSGVQVKTLVGSIFNGKFLSPPIEWDGSDDFGGRMARGVYFYRLKIRNLEGQVAEKYEKLLYLK